MRKNFFILIFLVLFSFNCVSAANLYVNTSGSDLNTGINTTLAKQTIKNVTLTANNKDTIYISKGTYYENNISINKSLTIIGDKNNGTVIDAQKKGRIFKISRGARVTIKYVTFKNADSGKGGAILSYGTLYVDKCKFINNKASNGGAINSYSKYGKLTVKNSIFQGNIAINGGGAINNVFKTATVHSSVFNNNKAKAGGAIYVNKISIKKSKFNRNIGTAIYANKIKDIGSSFI